MKLTKLLFANPNRVSFVVGQISKVVKHPEADSLYVSTVNVGTSQAPRTVCSGLVYHYSSEQLLNRHVMLVNNLKPSKLRGIVSEAMVLAAENGGVVDLISPASDSAPGDVYSFASSTDNSDSPGSAAATTVKPSVWKKIQPGLSLQNGLVVFTHDDGSVTQLKNQAGQNCFSERLTEGVVR